MLERLWKKTETLAHFWKVKFAQSCPTLCNSMDYTACLSGLPAIIRFLFYARLQLPRLIQGVRSGDGVGEDQDTIASIRY